MLRLRFLKTGISTTGPHRPEARNRSPDLQFIASPHRHVAQWVPNAEGPFDDASFL
jgi:hypothetical protein